MNSNSESTSEHTKRSEHLSKDGKWRSFPKVPNLLQYVSNGNYYGRIKIDGKIIRESLQTRVWTTAKMRLVDFEKKIREVRPQIDVPTFGEVVELYKQDLANKPTIKIATREYRLRCLNKINKTWPDLSTLSFNEISSEACKDWGARLNKQIASHYYNNVIGTLVQVIDFGVKLYRRNGGALIENPARELDRVRVKQKNLHLPEPSQFKLLLGNLRLHSGGWGPRVADLIEFLAYSGMRVHSEAIWVKWEDVDWQKKEILVRGNPETGTKNGEMRRVPVIPDMEQLLMRLKDKLGSEPCSGAILKVGKCNEALARACKEIGIQKLTHHDMRHLFATRCIESGVDIPTVAKWLGHKDGGALAMKTYGHLRNEHSRAMAEKVKF